MVTQSAAVDIVDSCDVAVVVSESIGAAGGNMVKSVGDRVCGGLNLDDDAVAPQVY